MAPMFETLQVIVGIAVVFYILNDVFQSVVVPRSTPARYRLTRWVVRPGWRAWRAIGLRTHSPGARERIPGAFDPTVVAGLLLRWLVGLALGYGWPFIGR